MKKIFIEFKEGITKKDLIIFLIVTLGFIIWLSFIDSFSWTAHNNLDHEIDKFEEQKEFYIKEMNSDKEKLNTLKQIDGIEKYAREKYYMKKENEDIYIIDFIDKSNKNE